MAAASSILTSRTGRKSEPARPHKHQDRKEFALFRPQRAFRVMYRAKKYSYSVVPEWEDHCHQTFGSLVRSADFSYIQASFDMKVPEVAAALLSYQLPHRWLLEHRLDGAFSAREEDGDIVFDLIISELNDAQDKEREHISAGAVILRDGHLTLPEQSQTMDTLVVVDFLSEQIVQWGSTD